MTRRTFLLSAVVLFAAILSWHVPQAAASSAISLSPRGSGVWLLQGAGIENAAAMEFTVLYDRASLVNPRVELGDLVAGAMSAVNTNAPGVIRMALVRVNPVNGSGVIATIRFDSTGAAAGKITSLSARLANLDGQSIPASVQVVNPSAGPASETPPRNVKPPSPAAPSGQPAGPESSMPTTLPQTVIIAPPQEGAGAGRNAPVKQQDMSATGARPDLPASVPQSEESPVEEAYNRPPPAEAGGAKGPETSRGLAVYTQKSVLDLFREYRGERTPKDLMALFDKGEMIGFRQEPPVAISDGRTTVTVRFLTKPGDIHSSDIAVLGARLLSMKRDPENTNTWIVGLMPEKGSSRASIAVSQGTLNMVYPLVVAPPTAVDLDGSGTFTEKDFRLFLKKRAPAKARPHASVAGRRADYFDDYVFTANFLAVTGR